jgi:hypothetical protein
MKQLLKKGSINCGYGLLVNPGGDILLPFICIVGVKP